MDDAVGVGDFLTLAKGEGHDLQSLGFYFAYRANKSPRLHDGLLRIDDDTVSFAGKVLCQRRDLRSVLPVPRDGQLYLRLTRGRGLPALLLAVSSEQQGREILRTIGFDASQSVAELRALSPYFALPGYQQLLASLAPVLLAGVMIPITALAGRTAAPFAALAFVLTTLLFVTAIALASRLSVGADGLLSRWLWRSRFSPFSQVQRVDPIERRTLNKRYLGVELTLRDGSTTFLPIGQKRWSEEEFHATVERIGGGAGSRGERHWRRAKGRCGPGCDRSRLAGGAATGDERGMAGHEHSHGGDGVEDMALTGLTFLGLRLVALHHYLQPLPVGLYWAALALGYVAGGVPPLLRALRELWQDHVLDIDLLKVTAALAALAVGAGLEGAVLLALFSISGTLEHRAMGRARRAVEALMQPRPEFALLQGPEGVTEVPVESLKPGDHVVLRPDGARVPGDGRVVEGTGRMDESTVTQPTPTRDRLRT